MAKTVNLDGVRSRGLGAEAGADSGPVTAAPRVLTHPRSVQQRLRAPKKNIPQTSLERNRMLQAVRHYLAEFNPVPPLPLAQVKEHASRVIELLGCDPIYQRYAGVLLNNEMWRESLAAVPYSKRLLLLPKCLRVENKCPAPFDEFGLLCKQCGLCTIQDLQSEAESLGYAVLVAEGSAVVTSLIQTGKIEAILGVSCLGVLERAFPYMEAAAIPGIAIPLLQDDCADTTVDLDWVWEYIHLTNDDQTRRLDLGALRDQVDRWFAAEQLETILGQPAGETESISREWLAAAGKRWRPFLTVAVFEALRRDRGEAIPEFVCRVAAAVECFHKASLVHDDIEDNDAARYGEPSLHERYGVPVALNVGDLLIGEGYRLISASGVHPELMAEMLAVASQGQRQLCHGQGAELCWNRAPQPLSSAQVLDIFRQKTAPAFEVALKLGVLCASQTEPLAPGSLLGGSRYSELAPALRSYSEALGIAYQIRDDLSDGSLEAEASDLAAVRPGLLLALGFEQASGADRELLEAVWRRASPLPCDSGCLGALLERLGVRSHGLALLESYKDKAVRSLACVENPNLKGLLRRVIGRIFNGTEIKGWCKEFQPADPAAPALSDGPSRP